MQVFEEVKKSEMKGVVGELSVRGTSRGGGG